MKAGFNELRFFIIYYKKMNQSKVINYLTQNISSLNGVGEKIMRLLKKKKIEKISDLLWNTPQGFTDRSNVKQLDNLEI